MKPVISFAALIALAACAQPEASSRALTPVESLDVAKADRSDCARGVMDGGRSFILCEDGTTSLAAFQAALRGPVDTGLNLEAIAGQYALAPQTFSDIEPATYSDLVLKDRVPAPATFQAMRPYDSVTVDGQTFDVFRVALGEKAATIFVERQV